MSTIVSVARLQKKIGKKQVLQGLDFQIEAGRVVGLLGPNGAGKTTLIKILMNLYKADAGEVRICGESADGNPQQYHRPAGHSHLGPLWQLQIVWGKI